MLAKFFTAIGVGILPAVAGLVYPLFYRNDGKLYIIFAAFTAGAVLAVGVQNISYSIMYTWAGDTGEFADIYVVAQHVMWQFAVFFFLRFCFGMFYKDILEKLSPPNIEIDINETEGLLQESRENILMPNVFDGSSDLMGSMLVLSSLSTIPFMIGFSIGVSPFDHKLTLAAYTLHRIAGAVALSRSLDLRGTPSMYSWMSLASYSLSFPIGIIFGSFCERDYVNGFVIMQCSMTAAVLIYEAVVEHLPKIVKSARLVFAVNGEYYVYASFAGALLLFLVLASQPPLFRHDVAKHPLPGRINHGSRIPNENPPNNNGSPNAPPANSGQNNQPVNNNNNGNYYPPGNNNNNGEYYPPANNNNQNNGGGYPNNNGGYPNSNGGNQYNGGGYPNNNGGYPNSNGGNQYDGGGYSNNNRGNVNNDFGYQPNHVGRHLR